MPKKKRGFFASLFRRRKKGFDLTVGAVIARLVENAAAALPGKAQGVAAERVEVDELREEIISGGPGAIAVFITASYPPDAVLALPDSVAAGLAAGEPGGAPALMAGISARLSDFLTLAPPAEDPPPAAQAPHCYVKRYGPADAAELSWRASGCACFRLSLGNEGQGGRMYSFVESGVEARAQAGFESSREYADAVRALLQPPKQAAPAPQKLQARTVTLGASREFLFGGLFIHPRIQCGKHLLESRFLSVSLGTDGRHAGPGTWARMACMLGGRKWQVWYFFPAPQGGQPQNRETIKGLAGCIMKEALRSAAALLSARPESPEMALDSRPDLSGKTGLLVLAARVAAGAAAFPCDVVVEYGMLSPLLKSFLDPAEIAQAPKGPYAVLPLVFCLNQSLFRRRLSTFHKDFTDAGSEDAIPFATFLDLLPDRDCAVILQNYTLKTAGTRGLKRLFFYAETVTTPDGRTVSRLYTPHPFDEARLLSFLPQNAREDWEVGKRDAASSAAEYRGLNHDMIEGIRQAARRKTLLVSPRTMTVLETIFMPGVRAKAREELDRAAAAGIPFGSLKRLSKAQTQQFLATQPNRLLCLALIGAEGELPSITANISKKRASTLSEDLGFIKAQHASGAVETQEVLEAKRELEREIKKAVESWAKQAAREKARGGARNGAAAAAPSAQERPAGGQGGGRARYKGWATGKKRPIEEP